MTETSLVQAAQHLALDLGWPVLPIQARAKVPLTLHGVKDATTDERTILHWFDKWPNANIGVATGLPGPQVLDIDRPQEAAFLLAQLQADHPPEAATSRGRHLYYQGMDRGTITVGFGELRGVGSYVVCPPSVHPDGSMYVWLHEPNGTLPQVPAHLAGLGQTAGTGTMPARTGRVGHGERHDHLKDMAVRLVRSGVVDPATLESMLEAEYLKNCELEPAPRRDEFKQLAKWAAGTRIAGRERQAPLRPMPVQAGGTGAEHRQTVDQAGGWAPLSVASVKRYGNRLVDALHIYLSDGRVVDFPRQDTIVARGGWSKAIIAATDGDANPPSMKDAELHALYRALCVLSGKSQAQLEADDHADLLADLLGICEPLTGHQLQDAAGRYQLIEALRSRPLWDPFDRQTLQQPVLVQTDDGEYLRAGELMTWFRFRGASIHTREFPGRMGMIGLTHLRLNGRQGAGTHQGRRATNTTLLYQITNQEDPMTDQPNPTPEPEPDPAPDPDPQPEPNPDQTEIPAEPAE